MPKKDMKLLLEEVFGLPNIKSAKKRVLVTAAKAAQNKSTRSALKTTLKKFDAAVAEGNRSEADSAYKVAVRPSIRLLPRVCCTRTMLPTRSPA